MPHEKKLLDCLQVDPRGGDADAAVLWLHGLGADGYDFQPIVPELRIPPEHRIRFVFPHAPHIPVTLNGGMVMPAWYDVYGLNVRDRQDAEGIRRSAAQTEALIQRERDRGIAPERIVVAGFSQGGAIAYQVGLRYPDRLAGILALSTWLPLADTVADEASAANASIPILHCHGTFDPMVHEARGRDAVATLQQLGYAPEYVTYPMQHQVCLEEIERVGAWLASVLPVRG